MHSESKPLAVLGPPGHIGIVVADLDEAMSTMSPVAGRFRKLPTDAAGVPIETSDGIAIVDLRVAYSIAGPPFIELIRGVAGSFWDRRAAPYVHHLGYWIPAREMESTSAKLSGIGLRLLARRPHGSGEIPRIIYHAYGDVRIELVDERRRDDLRIGAPDP